MKEQNFWDKFPKTDPQYTKQTNEGGRRATSITPVYMVKLATDVLGPIGIGWGYRVIEERFDNTAPIVLIEGDKSQGKPPVYMTDNGAIVYEKTHTIHLEMWIGEKANTFSQFGHTRYSYMTKQGRLYIDHEYAKKTLTDAMTKCLSLIGVCSDVYMGEFDNVEYQEAAAIENAISKADNKAAEIEKHTTELDEYISKRIKVIEDCPTMEAVGKVYGLAAHKVDLMAQALKIDAEKAKAPLNAKYFEMEKRLGVQ